jgi:hypothetical protein
LLACSVPRPDQPARGREIGQAGRKLEKRQICRVSFSEFVLPWIVFARQRIVFAAILIAAIGVSTSASSAFCEGPQRVIISRRERPGAARSSGKAQRALLSN